MKKTLLFCLMIILINVSSCSQEGLNNSSMVINSLQESEIDNFGMYKFLDENEYNTLLDEGIKVVNLDETFFVLYVPDNYQALENKLILVNIHGSYGLSYAEIKDELEFAEQYGYALVALQWQLGGKDYPAGKTDKIFKNSDIYELIDIMLQYMELQYGSDLNKVGYSGFSAGSAISYHLATIDSLHKNYFKVIICQSGGIPENSLDLNWLKSHKIKDPRDEEIKQFYSDMVLGNYGYDILKGKTFFMYCGMKDEEWGTEQCEQMHNAEQFVQTYGGTIAAFIEAPEGLHAGYKSNTQFHQEGILTFLSLVA